MAAGVLAQKLQAMLEELETVEAVRAILDELIRAGDAQEGIHPSRTLIMVKQTRLALDEVEL